VRRGPRLHVAGRLFADARIFAAAPLAVLPFVGPGKHSLHKAPHQPRVEKRAAVHRADLGDDLVDDDLGDRYVRALP